MVENRDVRVGFRVTGSEWVGVSQAAELDGVRVSEWVRRAVVEKLQRDSGESPVAMPTAEFPPRRPVLEPDALAVRAAEQAEERRQRWLARQPKKA